MVGMLLSSVAGAGAFVLTTAVALWLRADPAGAVEACIEDPGMSCDAAGAVGPRVAATMVKV